MKASGIVARSPVLLDPPYPHSTCGQHRGFFPFTLQGRPPEPWLLPAGAASHMLHIGTLKERQEPPNSKLSPRSALASTAARSCDAEKSRLPAVVYAEGEVKMLLHSPIQRLRTIPATFHLRWCLALSEHTSYIGFLAISAYSRLKGAYFGSWGSRLGRESGFFLEARVHWQSTSVKVCDVTCHCQSFGPFLSVSLMFEATHEPSDSSLLQTFTEPLYNQT